ncbi:uncharacterized protein LOC143289690 [Babylonia areolata]|uniref:uncharacterized protein LOC143289690 n=1 Tax=Babylonia areolata TaxID=304850 RepID=UPI003FD4DFBC
MRFVFQNTSQNKGCVQIRLNETEHLPWDNPDNIVSQEVEMYANKIRDLSLVVLFPIGVPANVINMAVFYTQGLQDRVNVCLFLLALFDGVYLTSGLCLHAENIYLYLTGQGISTPFNMFMANNNLISILGSGFVSFVLSAIIACERCYCVLRPLKYQTLLQTRTMAVIIGLLCFCVFGLFFVVSYRFWVRCVYDPVTGELSMKITGGGIYNSHKALIDFVDSIIFGAVFSGGMIIVVIAATVITTTRLRQIITWRTETSSFLTVKEVTLSKMLVANTVFFIICSTPACVFRLVFLFLPEMSPGGKQHNFYFATLWTLEGFAFVNSSFNFFIYYTMGSRYRETFWAMLGKP